MTNTGLFDADLSEAVLTGANLAGAILDWADLTGAKLIGTDLTNTTFSYSAVDGADFTDALLPYYPVPALGTPAVLPSGWSYDGYAIVPNY